MGTDNVNTTRTLALRMQTWKHGFLRDCFPERDFVFAPVHISAKQLRTEYTDYLKRGNPVYVWSLGLSAPVMDVLVQSGVKLHIVEDGFLRSSRAFASRTIPLSLAIDHRTAHFDASRSSDLETLLETYPFEQNPDLMVRARSGLELLLTNGVSKYNGGSRISANALYGPKTKRRVLVLGQVDGDASIRFGCPSGFTQTDMVYAAVAENPDCEIIFRPHPDVVNRVRPTRTDHRKLSQVCRIITAPASINDAFDTIDKVYTLTSLGGFEALMRGIPVTVFGYPFYAGWGLTDDRSGIARRQRRLSLDQIFTGAYLLYPRYFDPSTGAVSTFESTIAILMKGPSAVDERRESPPKVRLPLRHRVAVRLIKPVVRRIGSEEDGRYFTQYPFDFFQERPSRWLRWLGHLLFIRPHQDKAVF